MHLSKNQFVTCQPQFDFQIESMLNKILSEDNENKGNEKYQENAKKKSISMKHSYHYQNGQSFNPFFPLGSPINANFTFMDNDIPLPINKPKISFIQNNNIIVNTNVYNFHKSNENFGKSKKCETIKKNVPEKSIFEYNSVNHSIDSENLIFSELLNIIKDSEKIDYSIYKRIQNNLVYYIKSQKGSRIIQQFLKNTQNEILHLIFIQIKPHLTDLLKDHYANYFCKKMFSFLNQKDRIDFLSSIQSQIPKLSKHKIATYPIQGIIQEIGSKFEKMIIIRSIENLTQDLCFDPFGVHVLEKIFTSFEESFYLPILNYVKNNFLLLANNVNGICIVKKVLTMTHKRSLHEELKQITKLNVMNLIQNPFGKYVIQVILDVWDDTEIKEILSPIENNYSFLSMQKHSSNLIEKIIEKNPYYLSQFIHEIFSKNLTGEIMKDNFGNYVIQKALKVAYGELKQKLAEKVRKNIYDFKDKKLITKWKRLVSK